MAVGHEIEHVLACGVVDIFHLVRALRQRVEGEAVGSIRVVFAMGTDETEIVVDGFADEDLCGGRRHRFRGVHQATGER